MCKRRRSGGESPQMCTWRISCCATTCSILLPKMLLTTGSKLGDGERKQIDAEVEQLLDAAVEFARQSPRPNPEEAFDYVYASGLRPRDGVAPQ